MMVFCMECRNLNEYEVGQEQVERMVKNKHISYCRKFGLCKECKTPVFVGDLHNENLKSIDDELSKQSYA